MLTLFESVTEGIHWGEVLDPLSTCCSPVFSVIFVCYMAFMIFALMNVATAIFVESALHVATEEEITREMFETHMFDPRMEGFLKCLELDADRAVEEDLFGL